LYYRERRPGMDQRAGEELKKELLAEMSLPSHDGAEQAAWQREKEALRRELLREIARARALEKAPPHRDLRRAALAREIMEEAWESGLPPDELYARLAGPARSSLRGRLKALVASREGKSFGWGVGLTLAAVLLAPGARRLVRPAARKVVEEVMEAGNRLQQFIARTREDLEDLVAEAKFHQMANTETPGSGNDAGSDPGEG